MDISSTRTVQRGLKSGSKRIKKDAANFFGTDEACCVLAPTGVAAVNVDGDTVHSAVGIALHSRSSNQLSCRHHWFETCGRIPHDETNGEHENQIPRGTGGAPGDRDWRSLEQVRKVPETVRIEEYKIQDVRSGKGDRRPSKLLP
ncbi:hypothetical protein CAEBREN_01921 [Caenorhabditis brenneri]|uniref:Uncharacterized protein n=1 Tax=Caenorhabditis brenneri TaxID=135651 RepID=G0PGM4_CAEBE|nr:hypothetical protein CAEBREN_01921 [Caenorhabditis brenneri]